MIKIRVSKDFTYKPGGRFQKEGEFSGEEFREKILKPKYLEAKEKGEPLEVNMDGCFGYPLSFIEESFGGLAREFKDSNMIKIIHIISDDQPSLAEFIKKCLEVANEKSK